MLKQTVTYTDFNDEKQSETLYFNVTKTELMDIIEIQDRLEAWQGRTSGASRELTIPEIKEMLDILKTLVDASYGVRSEDGKRFRKSPEILADFKSSAAYDAFFFDMFENVDKAINFMVGILPKDLLSDEDTAKVRELQGPAKVGSAEEIPLPEHVDEIVSTDKEVPAWIREDREPTSKEMAKMDREELMLAFKRKSEKATP